MFVSFTNAKCNNENAILPIGFILMGLAPQPQSNVPHAFENEQPGPKYNAIFRTMWRHV